MDLMKALIIDAIAPEGVGYLTDRGFDVEQVSSKMPRDELFQKIAGYEAIVTRSSTTVNAEFLAHARRLRFLGRAGVGVDNIDVDACSRQGVIVANAPYGNVVSAAEHTVGMLLALLRKIPAAHEALKRLAWDRGIYGSELFRKTAGVIGLGKVGSRVAARLRAFEMAVLVYDPYIPESRARELNVRLTDLQSLLTQSDIVTVHVPLSDETENMLAAREIALMKPGVRLVNCARGGIISEAALLDALDSGHVAGAAIDVWTEEPPVSPQLKRLVQHPHVVVTPHLGANSQEAQVNVAIDVARQLVGFRDGELVEHAVNVPVGDRESMAELKPFVNLVNARFVARERGLEVVIATDEAAPTGYTNLITVTTYAGSGRKIIAGTVFDGVPRIVRLRDLHIEFVPEGHILVLSYEDRPGMVGKIGTILGRRNVNIASMHVGRRTKRGNAIVVLLLDEDVPPEVMEEVAKAVEADFARVIRLED